MHEPDLRNIRRLEAFVEVAELRSFSRAAHRLQLTQPAVSRYIKEIERSIGAPLFEHRQRNLALTEAGQVMYGHARKIITLMEEMESAITGAGGTGFAGPVRVGVGAAWEYPISDALVEFQREHPQVRLRITIGRTREITDWLLENQVSLGFVTEHPRDARLDVTQVAESELVLLAAPDHPLARAESVMPEQLEHERFIAYASDQLAARSQTYLGQTGLRPAYVMEIQSFEGVKRAVARGVGIAMIMAHAASGELAAGTLVRLRVEAPPWKVPLYALRARSRYVPPAHQAVLDFILARFREGEAPHIPSPNTHHAPA